MDVLQYLAGAVLFLMATVIIHGVIRSLRMSVHERVLLNEEIEADRAADRFVQKMNRRN